VSTPTDPTSLEEQVARPEPLSIKDLATLLVHHYGLTEGRFDILVEFQIGVGAVGPSNARLPGAIVGVQRVGLTPVAPTVESDSIVDAAAVRAKVAGRPVRRASRRAPTKAPAKR
jgi:hypothetical protein